MIKLKLIQFIIFLYSEYLYEDYSIFTKNGKFLIYPLHIFRILYIPILLPMAYIDFLLNQLYEYMSMYYLQNN